MTLLAAAVLTLLTSASALSASTAQPPAPCHDVLFEGRSFAIYALSVGRGVPDETFAFYNSSKARLQCMQGRGLIVLLTDTRIGIEGERKLCAVFADGDTAKRTWNDLCEQSHAIPLLNLEMEECKQGP